jgi:hypothetical protein
MPRRRAARPAGICLIAALVAAARPPRRIFTSISYER